MANLRIELVRSTIGNPKDQRETVRALGLRRIRQVVEKPDNPAIRGMVFKVRHLVRVEEVPDAEESPIASGQPARKTRAKAGE